MKEDTLTIDLNDINKLLYISWNAKYCICMEIQKYGVFIKRRKQKQKKLYQCKGVKNRSKSIHQTYAYANRDTTEKEYLDLWNISKVIVQLCCINNVENESKNIKEKNFGVSI